MQEKLKKGQYGYLKRLKKLRLINSIVAILIVFAVLFVGIGIYGSKKNILTVGAAVLSLPAAKIIISYLLLIRHKLTTVEAYNRIQGMCKADIYFDMVYSVAGKVIYIPYMAVNANSVLIYSEAKDDIVSVAENGITEFVKKSGYRVNVKITNDMKLFEKRLKSMTKSEEDTKGVIEALMIMHV